MFKKSIKKIAVKIIYSAICLFKPTYKLNLGSILIIAPHPDDEIIGLGGVIIKTIREEAKLNILYLTDGEGSGADPDKEIIKQSRIFLTNKVAQKLDIPPENIYRLHLPDSTVPRAGKPGFDEAVAYIKNLIETSKVETVFATDPLEYWPFDHLACSEMAAEAVKLSENKPELWYYWVWTWFHIWHLWRTPTKPLNGLRKIGISREMETKRELTDLYLKPLSSEGKPWSGVLPEAMIYPFTKPFEFIRKP